MTAPTSPTGSDAVVQPATQELDVRPVPKPERHPLIFARFDTLAIGESFVLVNSHDPRHLRQEFDRDHPGAYDWTYLPTGDRQLWRIKITRRAAADLPRIVADTSTLRTADATAAGAVWRLESAIRHLDANVIRLRPDSQIANHVGPDLDVLLHVLAGAGEIVTATGAVEVRAGAIVWLPRRSQRAILAGPDGLTYMSVHTRRPGLTITSRPPDSAGRPAPTGKNHDH